MGWREQWILFEVPDGGRRTIHKVRWRRQKEMEFKENRRQQNQEHELRMMELLGCMFHGGNNHSMADHMSTYHSNY